jgi:ABC-2 type transport system ATP-binding protein
MAEEGTPGELKARIGHPHLELSLADDPENRAGEVLAPFGRVQPGAGCDVQVMLEHGAEQVADVVRALDRAGITVLGLDLVEPTLDDVFLAETGHHLEGDEEEVVA